jgi:TPR repeat protein
MADIFISYASVDRPTARRLADALEARGWSVWWDHRSLRSGEHFDRIIEEAISEARAVIVVWSQNSVGSDWVRAEAAKALDEKKLMPLRIDRTSPPLRFRNVHTIDLSEWTGEVEAEPFERLIKDLSHHLGPPIGPPISARKAEQPVNYAEPGSLLKQGKPIVNREAGSSAPDINPARLADGSHRSSTGGNQQPAETATTADAAGALSNSGSSREARTGRYFAAAAAAGVVMGAGLLGVVILEPAPPEPPPTSAASQKSPPSAGDGAAAVAAYNRADYTTALSLSRPAAERGDPVAENVLGRLYETGRGVPQDYAEAARWYRKAADQGDALAQNNLGVLYTDGRGVAQDYAEALRWYRKAADQGDAFAQYNIGRLYETGRGVPKDMAQTREWMRKAAVAGDEDAKNWLADH